MTIEVVSPHFSCVCSPSELEEALSLGYKEVYIQTRNAIIKHHQLRGNDRFVRVEVKSIPGYTPPKEEVVKQEIRFLPDGKIPYAIWEQLVAFFRKVMSVNKEELEAMAHVLWNPEKGYHIGVPSQTVSKASANYDRNYVPAGTSIVLDIHSHNTMSSFFSSVDDRDDTSSIMFSAVVGKLNDKEPAVVCRFNYYTTKIAVKIEDIVEMPIHPEVEVPAEWLAQVKTPVYQGYQGYQGYHGPNSSRGGHNSSLYPSGKIDGYREGPGIRQYPQTGLSHAQRNQLAIDEQAALWDDLYGVGGSSLGEPWGALELANQSSVNKSASNEKIILPSTHKDVPSNSVNFNVENAEQAYLELHYGKEIADAVTLMGDCMSSISDEPVLLEEAVTDLVSLVKDDEAQLSIVRKICSNLSSSARDKLMNSGL